MGKKIIKENKIIKKITMPKPIYDRYMQDVKNGFAPHHFRISQIKDPYNGQLAIDDENVLHMYRNNEWCYVELPKWINPIGKCVFGDFKTYYIYWINYQHPENYGGSYMLSSHEWHTMYDDKNEPYDDEKIHEAICNIASTTIKIGGEVIFTQTVTEATMQACIKTEQYKYEMISAIVKQFENISCEFIPEEGEEDEN